jgi:hypothetical protein
MGHADAGFTRRVYTGLFDKEASAEKVRAATGNREVTRSVGTAQVPSAGQVLPFPGNPHDEGTEPASSAQNG